MIGNKADIDGVDLGDGGDGEGCCYARCVGGGKGKLYFEGGSPVLREGHGADFKAMEEHNMHDFLPRHEQWSKWKKDLNFFTTGTPRQ